MPNPTLLEHYRITFDAYFRAKADISERQRHILQGYLTGLAFAIDKIDPSNEREPLPWQGPARFVKEVAR